jgi:hypothetical protein
MVYARCLGPFFVELWPDWVSSDTLRTFHQVLAGGQDPPAGMDRADVARTVTGPASERAAALRAAGEEIRGVRLQDAVTLTVTELQIERG